MRVAAAVREAAIIEVMVAAMIRAAIAVFIGLVAFTFGYKEVALELIEYVIQLSKQCKRALQRS